jgi:mercuric ion binding protein
MRFPMIRLFRSTATLLLLFTAAATRPDTTITLDVPGMTCATCPITVKKALTKVPGVTRVAVSYERLEAVVTFDESRVAVADLIRATTRAGYPSTIKTPRAAPRGTP